MFKQIFENKISEKITNINNSGKSAIEWMDKFRQSLDITEKIQQQFNNNEFQINNLISSSNGQLNQNLKQPLNSLPNSSPLNVVKNQSQHENSNQILNKVNNNNINNQNGLNNNNNNNNSNNNELNNGAKDLSNKSNKTQIQEKNLVPTSNNNQQGNLPSKKPNVYRKESIDSFDGTFSSVKNEENNNNNLNAHNNSSPPHSPNRIDNNSSLSIGSIVSVRNNSFKNNIKVKETSSNLSVSNDVEPVLSSSSSALSQKSDHFNNHGQLQHAKSIADDSIESNNVTIGNNEYQFSSHKPRTLVRQSTDLTSSFPLKRFQRINSETVEIPGLNVKVVRYRIENDLGTFGFIFSY